MTKKNIIIDILLALFVLGIIGSGFLLFYDTRDVNDNKAKNINSADNSATMAVVLSSLKNSEDVDKLKISRVTDKNIPLAIKQLKPMAVYNLEPSGTQFKKDITIKIKADLENGSIPTLLNISNEGNEVVKDVKVTFNKDKKELDLIEAKINHFSKLALIGGPFALECEEELGEYAIGESFSMPVTVINYGSYRDGSGLKVGIRNVSLTGMFDAFGNVEPYRIINKPAQNTSMTKLRQNIDSGKLKCIREGEGYVGYEMMAIYNLANKNQDILMDSGVISAHYACRQVSIADFDAATACGGSVAFTGQIQYLPAKVTQLKITISSPDDGIIVQNPSLNKTSGKFSSVATLAPGTYKYIVEGAYNDNPLIEIKKGFVTVKECPKPKVAEVSDEFICCEKCPATLDDRFYWPFPGEDCLSGDVRRYDLNEQNCANPMTIGNPGKPTYGANCPK